MENNSKKMYSLRGCTSYRTKKQKPEGVHFIEETGKWIVRIIRNVSTEKRPLRLPSTVGMFDSEEKANNRYNELKNLNNKQE